MVNISEPDVDNIASDFHRLNKASNAYQDSDQQQLDNYTIAHEEHVAPLAEAELQNQNEGRNKDSFLMNIAEIPADIGVGLVRSVEEIAQTAGAKDNLFSLNKPDDTFSALVQGFGQFAGPFIPAMRGVSVGTKFLGLLKKSPKLKTAVDSMVAGMPVDAFAFDPQEGNIFNFAIAALGVSEDSRSGAAIRDYLAVKSDDPDALARAKNALSGVLGSVLFERFIRLMGGTIKAGTRAVKKLTSDKVDYFKEDAAAGDTIFGNKDLNPTDKDGGGSPNTINDRVDDDAFDIFSREDYDAPTNLQEFPSHKTDINWRGENIALFNALISRGKFGKGTRNVDIGGGQSDFINKQMDGENIVIDPFNRSREENLKKIADLKKNPADSATFANVFNVIKEDENIVNALRQAQALVKEGGEIHIGNYKAPKKGQVSTEPTSFQRGENPKEYLRLVKEVFPEENISQKGNVITIINTKKKLSFDDIDDITLKEGADDLGTVITDTIARAKESLSEEELAFVGAKFDSWEGATYREANKEIEDFAEFYHKATDEAKDEYVRIFTDVIEGKSLNDIDLETLNPFNITKLHSSQERLSIIAQLGEIMKDKLPRNLSKKGKEARRRFLDEEINRITKFWGVAPEQFVKHLKTVTNNVDDALAYIQSSKLITDIQVQKGLKLGKVYLNSKDPKDLEAFTSAVVNSVETARGASGLGTAFGRGLAEFKHIAEMGDLASQTDLMKAKMMNELISSTPELGQKRAAVMTKLDEIAKLEKKENPERFKESLTDEQLADINVKRLEKYLSDLEAGKDPKQKRIRTPEEQQVIDQIKAFKAEKKLKEIFSADQIQARARFKSTLMSAGAKTRDVLSEIYINGLLSSIKTSVVNFTGNATAIMSSIIDRWYAGATNTAVDGVTLGEAAQLTWSYVASFPDFWRVSWYSMKNGVSEGAIKSDFIKPHDPAITPELFNAQGNVAKAINYIGKAVNIPGKALLASDEGFKMLSYRAEINALSYRKAKSLVGEIGDKRILGEKFGEIKNNILDHPDIMEQAKGFSELNTFTNRLPEIDHVDFNTGDIHQVGGMSRTFKKLIDRDRTGVLRIFIPFFQTPVNLLSFAGQRTPLIRKMSDSLMADLKSPNIATKQLAEAKVATGNFMWATAIGLAMTGNFTGAPPYDANLRRRQEEAMGGAFWYSYMTDDGWVNYNRLDPLGIILSGATTMTTMAKSLINLTDLGNKEGFDQEIFDKYQETFANASIGLTRMITDRHYLQGFGNLIDLVTGDQRGLSKGLNQIATFVDPTASFYSSFRRGIHRGVNPTKEARIKQEDLLADDPTTAGYQAIIQEMDKMFATSLSLIPGIGEERPASINLVGEKRFHPGTSNSDELHVEPLEIMSNLTSTMFNPFASGKKSKSAIINKLARLGSTLQGPETIRSIDGVNLSQEEHQFFAETWAELNKGLEKRVRSKAFNNQPEGAQLQELENSIKLNKRMAQMQTKNKFGRIFDGSLYNKLDSLKQMSTQTLPQTGTPNLFNLGQ